LDYTPDKLMRYVDGSTGTSSPYNSPTAGRLHKELKETHNANTLAGIFYILKCQ